MKFLIKKLKEYFHMRKLKKEADRKEWLYLINHVKFIYYT